VEEGEGRQEKGPPVLKEGSVSCLTRVSERGQLGVQAGLFFYRPRRRPRQDVWRGMNAHAEFLLADNPEVCAVHFDEMDKRLHKGSLRKAPQRIALAEISEM